MSNSPRQNTLEARIELAAISWTHKVAERHVSFSFEFFGGRRHLGQLHRVVINTHFGLLAPRRAHPPAYIRERGMETL